MGSSAFSQCSIAQALRRGVFDQRETMKPESAMKCIARFELGTDKGFWVGFCLLRKEDGILVVQTSSPLPGSSGTLATGGTQPFSDWLFLSPRSPGKYLPVLT